MRLTTNRARIAFGLLAAVGCQPRAAQFTAQDETALRSMFDSSLAHIRAGDWGAWAGMYTEDGLIQPPNGPSVRGRAQLQAWGQAFPPIESLTWADIEVHGDGNMAYGTSTYVLMLKDLPPDSGKQLAVFRRGPGGKWEVAVASYSSDLPPAGAPSGAPR